MPPAVSLAWTWRETASPALYQAKAALAEEVPLLTVTTGAKEPPAPRVPLTAPLLLLMLSPAGRPVAE